MKSSNVYRETIKSDILWSALTLSEYLGPGSYYVWVSACKCKGPYTSPYTENLFVIRDSFVFHSIPYNQTATALAWISMPMNDFQSEDLSL